MDGRRSRRDVSSRSRRMDLLLSELFALRNASRSRSRSRSRSPLARNPSPPARSSPAPASSTPPHPPPPPPMASPTYPLIDLADDTVELEVSQVLLDEMQGGDNDPSERRQRPPANLIQVTAVDNGRSVTINAPEDDIGVSVLNVLNAANAEQLFPQDPSDEANASAGGGSQADPPAATATASGRPTQSRSMASPPVQPVQLVKHMDKKKVFVDLNASGLEVQNALTKRMIYSLDFNLGDVKRKFNFYNPCNSYQVGKCDHPDFSHTSRGRPNGRWFSHICAICWCRAKLPFHHNLATCPYAVTTLDNTQQP